MIMRRFIPKKFKGTITEDASAKMFLEEVEKSFAKNKKTEISTILNEHVMMKFNEKENIGSTLQKCLFLIQN